MTRTPGETRLLALSILGRRGPMSASNLGEALWGDGSRKPQSYARPAGRLLHGLKVDELVREIHTDTHTLWATTDPPPTHVRREVVEGVEAAAQTITRALGED